MSMSNIQRALRVLKVVLYPVAGIAQFYLLPSKPLAAMLAIALVGLAAVNLSRLLDERR